MNFTFKAGCVIFKQIYDSIEKNIYYLINDYLFLESTYKVELSEDSIDKSDNIDHHNSDQQKVIDISVDFKD